MKNEEKDLPKDVISLDAATQDVTEWMDLKRMKPRQRESNSETIDELIQDTMSGQLSFDHDKMKVVQHLLFPIGKNEDVKTIEYDYRINTGKLNNHLKQVKAADVDGRFLAHITALSGVNSGIVSKMDTEDLSIAKNYALFFI